MTPDQEEAFNDIANKAIESANKVPVDLEDYIDGLELVVEEIKVAIQAAKETLPETENDM